MSQTPTLPEHGAAPPSPFVGLTYFTEESANYFFGRESERNVIISNLRAFRLTLLYAESGVGKSSLLRAGVASRLRYLAKRLAAQGEAPRYVPVVFSAWSNEPADGLIAEIEKALVRAGGTQVELPKGNLERAIAMAADATSSTLLIILDQFEEYFLYHPRQPVDNTFADQLARCVDRADLRANFLISVREDAYSSIGDVLKSRVANVYGNYLHLAYLDEDAARDAILKPIARFNALEAAAVPWQIEPQLIDAVLTDVQHDDRVGDIQDPRSGRMGREGAEPAYLQLIMLRLWNEEQVAGSRTLRLATLDRLGGAEAIVGTHVEQAMQSLPRKQWDAAAAIFRSLVIARGKGAALTARDLADQSDFTEAQLEPVLTRLAASDLKILRILVPDEGGREAIRYELFHDTLARPIRDWRAEHMRRAKERKWRRRVAGIAVFATVFVAILLAFTGFIVHLNREQTAARQSIESAARISDLTTAPTFGPATAAIASLAADRKIHGTFEARSSLLAQLQTNVGLPKLGVGHAAAVQAVAFFPNSDIVASGSDDGSVRLWDKLGRPLSAPLDAGQTGSAALSLAVSPDARILAVGRAHGAVDLWDVSKPAAPRVITKLPLTGGTNVNTVAFDPRGFYLVAGDNSGSITFWDIEQPESAVQLLLFDIEVQGPVKALVFGGDAAHPVLYVTGTRGVREYDLPERHGVLPDVRPTRPAVLWPASAGSFALASTGSIAWAVQTVANPGIELEIREGGRTHRLFLKTSDLVNSLAFADHGRVLISGGDDWNVTTWDVQTGRPFGPPRMESAAYDSVNSINVSPDGSVIAAGGDDKLVRLWPLTPGKALATTIGGALSTDSVDWGIGAIAIGPTGQVATAQRYDGVAIWPLAPSHTSGAPTPLQTIPALPGTSTVAVAWGGSVLAASDDGAVVLYDTGDSCRGRYAHCTLSVLGSKTAKVAILALSFDRSGRLLATAGSDGTVSLWNVSNPRAPKIESRLHQAGPVLQIAFNPTSTLLATAAFDHGAQLWSVRDARHPVPLGSPLRGRAGSDSISLAFSPDGRQLATGSYNGQIEFWTVDSRRGLSLSSVTLFPKEIAWALAFSPDGETLAAGNEASVCFYDIRSRRSIGSDQCLLTMGSRPNGPGLIHALAFTPDGKKLVSAGFANPLVEWDSILWDRGHSRAAMQELRSAACGLASQDLTKSQWNAVFVGTKLANHPEALCSTP